MGLKEFVSRISATLTATNTSGTASEEEIIGALAFKSGYGIARQYLMGYQMAEQLCHDFETLSPSQRYSIAVTYTVPEMNEYKGMSTAGWPVVNTAKTFSEETDTNLCFRNVVVVCIMLYEIEYIFPNISSEHMRFILHQMINGVTHVIPEDL